MAGKFSKTTTPGRGYTDAVSRSRGLTEKAGRGVPDERRFMEEEREGDFPGSAEDVTIPYDASASSPSEEVDAESDTAPSGRIQGG